MRNIFCPCPCNSRGSSSLMAWSSYSTASPSLPHCSKKPPADIRLEPPHHGLRRRSMMNRHGSQPGLPGALRPIAQAEIPWPQHHPTRSRRCLPGRLRGGRPSRGPVLTMAHAVTAENRNGGATQPRGQHLPSADSSRFFARAGHLAAVLLPVHVANNSPTVQANPGTTSSPLS